jgi:hypothetical protein
MKECNSGHNRDISFVILKGRLLTISGEITLGSAIVSKPIGTSAYTLGTLADFVLYTALGRYKCCSFNNYRNI